MWKITFGILIKSLRFETPSVRKNGFNKNLGRKSRDEFVKQPLPTIIVKIGAFFMFLRKNFMKKSKIQIPVSDSFY